MIFLLIIVGLVIWWIRYILHSSEAEERKQAQEEINKIQTELNSQKQKYEKNLLA